MVSNRLINMCFFLSRIIISPNTYHYHVVMLLDNGAHIILIGPLKTIPNASRWRIDTGALQGQSRWDGRVGNVCWDGADTRLVQCIGGDVRGWGCDDEEGGDKPL